MALAAKFYVCFSIVRVMLLLPFIFLFRFHIQTAPCILETRCAHVYMCRLSHLEAEDPVARHDKRPSDFKCLAVPMHKRPFICRVIMGGLHIQCGSRRCPRTQMDSPQHLHNNRFFFSFLKKFVQFEKKKTKLQGTVNSTEGQRSEVVEIITVLCQDAGNSKCSTIKESSHLKVAFNAIQMA